MNEGEKTKKLTLGPFRATVTLLSDLGSLLGGVFSLSILAYLVGWVSANAYFEGFGAPWLAKELGSFQLLTFSFSPLIHLAICAYLVLQWIEEGFPRNSWSDIVAPVIGVSIAFIGCNWYSTGAFASGLEASAVYLCALYSAAAFGAILLVINRTDYWMLPEIGYLFLIAAFFLLPSISASQAAKRDMRPDKSTLPRVQSESRTHSDLRLLHSARDILYVVDIGSSTYPISILSASSVKFILPSGALNN